MEGRVGLRSAGSAFLLVLVLIFLHSSFLPTFKQPSVTTARNPDIQRATLSDTLGGVLNGDLCFSPKLSQHGVTQDHVFGDQETISKDHLADIVSGSQSLDARQAMADDFTCAVGRPCKNGACCGASGNCGYGK